jgi:protoporphyrinogen oxidase
MRAMNDIEKKSVVVIGAGPMGLMSAYELLKKGYAVTIYEADDRIGGMTASFNFEGTKIERFYHFICGPDKPMFDLLKEFDLFDKLKWRDTKMGLYYQGKLHTLGDPISLLKFPALNIFRKLRYAWFAFRVSRIKDWRALDKIGVTEWLIKSIGRTNYKVMLEKLFYYKFYQHKDNLSAAWLGTRIKRVALSRRNIFQESMGYLEGGSDTLLDVIEEKIKALGGKIILNARVQQVNQEEGVLSSIDVNGECIPTDKVVSTIPLQYLERLIPGLPEIERAKISAIENVGVACVLFKLKQPYSKYFWMNINSDGIEIPGLIEYTNLNPLDKTILYAPYYLPADHPKYTWKNEQFIEEATGYLKSMKPNFNEEDILATHVARYQFAQTVCPPNFYSMLPPMVSGLKGLFMADTAYYYPEDRSICESVKLGKKLAELLSENDS